jgi:hypothetical protein
MRPEREPNGQAQATQSAGAKFFSHLAARSYLRLVILSE